MKILIGSSPDFISEDRVRRGAEKLSKYIGAKQQGRLDGFFKAVPKASPEKAGKAAESSKGKGKATKRKVILSTCVHCLNLLLIQLEYYRVMTKEKGRPRR